jgi:ATP-dependent HslUV protease subunit HslV
VKDVKTRLDVGRTQTGAFLFDKSYLFSIMECMIGTTIIGLKHKGKVAIGCDGQVTAGDAIMKHTARKIRKMYNNKILAGFAGSTADALTLFERFEAKLDEYGGNLPRSVVELAKDWRQDKVLRRLEAMLAILDKGHAYIVSGAGDIIEPDDGIVAIGSGGSYALAACRAMIVHANISAKEIVEESIKIAAAICIYTNREIFIEEL